MVMPTLSSDSAQTHFLIAERRCDRRCGNGRPDNRLSLQQLGTEHSHDVGVALAKDCWSRLEVAFELDGVSVAVSLDTRTKARQPKVASVSHVTSHALAGADHICFAAVWRGHPDETFNGSIENPSLSAVGLDANGIGSGASLGDNCQLEFRWRCP